MLFRSIAEQLRKTDTPVILVMNKIDAVKKDELLTFIDTYKDICQFAEIIPVSALTGENVERVIPTLFQYLEEGPQFYDEDTITDQPERQIVAELIREKALQNLSDEIPHGIAVAIDQMKEVRQNLKRHDHSTRMEIEATIICERESHKGIVIGKQGAMLKKIGSAARKEIEGLLDQKVNLQLWVKVKKDWRDSDFLLKNFGYRASEIDMD